MASFNLKCAKHMRIKGAIYCHDYDEDVFPCVQSCMGKYEGYTVPPSAGSR